MDFGSDTIGVATGWVARAIDLVDDETGRTVRLEPGLPVQDKDRLLRASKRHTEVGHRILAYYLWDMEERRESQLLGFPTTVDYAVKRLDLPRRSARELIEVGEALISLRRIDEAFAAGQLSWSRVRLLAKIVTPETESSWLAKSLEGSWVDFELQVKLAEKGKPPRNDRKGLPELRMKVPVSLDRLGHELWLQAKKKLGAERGAPVSDADALQQFAQLFLTSSPEGSLPGRSPSGESPFHVSVHWCAHCEQGTLATEDGPVPIEAASLAPHLAEAEITTVRESADPHGHATAEAIDRTTPPWMRDEVLARDGFRCSHCSSKRQLMVHHIVWRSKGGPTVPENLITCCVACHLLIHAGCLLVTGSAPHGLQWTDDQGQSTKYPAPADAPLQIHLPPEPSGPASSASAKSESPCAPSDLPADAAEVRDPESATRPRCVDLSTLPSRVSPELLASILHLLTWNERRGLLVMQSGATRPAVADQVPHPGSDDSTDFSLPHRPGGLDSVIGQARTVAALREAVQAAEVRGEAVSHSLLLGGPGLGKSGLMRAVAADLGTKAHLTSGPHLRDLGVLVSLVTRLGARDLLGIDEIHALPLRVAEALYEAMEDRILTLPITDGHTVRTLHLELPPFTVMGATTETAALPKPLVMRFPIREMLDWYDTSDLARILLRAADRTSMPLTSEAARSLARAGRDTPREALALFTRVRNAALASGLASIDAPFVATTLSAHGIDPSGLDPTGRRLLSLLSTRESPIRGTPLPPLPGPPPSTTPPGRSPPRPPA